MRQKFTLTNIAYQLLLLLLAIWPALYNQFPLVTPDTGAYVHNGIHLSLGVDRPFGYGLFILLSSLKLSLWGTIIAQGAIFSVLCQMLIHKLSNGKLKLPATTIITMLTVFGTSAAWFTSQLMADAFSGLMIIVLLLLFIGNNSKKVTFLLWVLLYCIQLTHSSHVIICFLCSLLLIFYFQRKKNRDLVKRSTYVIALSVASYLTISLSYAIGGHGFRFSPASHMFLMSRMAENGILDKYLEKKCPTEHWELCNNIKYTGNRQWEFMWSDNFPHSKENGWTTTREEYNDIIFGTLASPKYLSLHIIKNGNAGLRQLFQLYVGDGINQKNPPGSSPYNNIEGNFKHEIKEFSSSIQNTEGISFQMINLIISIFSVVCISTALFIYSQDKKRPANFVDWQLAIGLSLLYIVVNAFVTATFSTVIGRLQMRLFWVLPMMCIIFIFVRKTLKTEDPDTSI